ncbi:MAG: hypothetical protein EOM76_04840 [Sphingobacteriia bacterium]|nr:hypothetical protein [Sphingobacteriia bacterium]
MEIKLYRNHLIFSLIILVIIFYFLNRFNIVFDSEFVNGIVVGQKEWTNEQTKKIEQTAPIIEYNYDGEQHVFIGEINTKHKQGSKVEIILKHCKTENASIYDFTGFWLNAALYCIIPLIVFSAIILTFFDRNKYLNIRFEKKRIFSRGKSIKSSNNELFKQN